MVDLTNKIALVIDDEPDNITFISAILDDNKMKSIPASDGKEAMEKVKQTRPDVILLDLMMPGQSGMQFFNNLKKEEAYRDIPVIIVSGSSKVTGMDMKAFIYDKGQAERRKKVLGVEASPNDYIEKPVDPEKLIATIKKYVT